MLKILGNNFVLSGVVALILVIIVFVERRNSDKKNNHKSIKDWVFWGKLFGASYVLVLLVLLMKDKCPISGGGNSGSCEGNNCSFFGSLKSKFSKPSLPVQSAKPSAFVAPTVKTGVVSGGNQNVVSAAPASSGSELRVIDLNNVNIGDPDF